MVVAEHIGKRMVTQTHKAWGFPAGKRGRPRPLQTAQAALPSCAVDEVCGKAGP